MRAMKSWTFALVAALLACMLHMMAAYEDDDVSNNAVDSKSNLFKQQQHFDDKQLTHEKDSKHGLMAGHPLLSGFAVPALMLFLLGVLQKNGEEGANRQKRSTGNAWTQNLRKILGNVQKALDTYEHLEEEFSNDIDLSKKSPMHFQDHE